MGISRLGIGAPVSVGGGELGCELWIGWFACERHSRGTCLLSLGISWPWGGGLSLQGE